MTNRCRFSRFIVALVTLVRTMRGHTNEVGVVAFSPNGSTLATGMGDDTVKLWRLQ